MQINWIGVMASVNIAITTLNVGYTYAVRTEWIETETTQEGVLKTLDAHSKEISIMRTDHAAMHSKLNIMPEGFEDRWTGKNEIAAQASQLKTDHIQDRRIENLEDMHLYRHYDMKSHYNRRSNDN